MPPKKPTVTKAAAAKPAAKPGATKPAAKPAAGKAPPAVTKPKQEEKPPSVEIELKQLNTILNDVDQKMKGTGRWPLIIDESGASSTFLKYRDNFIDANNAIDFSPEKIRLAILGALRYGKGLCLDMGGDDNYEKCVARFAEITPDLMDLILSKDIMKEEHFSKLIKSVDDDEYQLEKMTGYEAKVEEFQMHFTISHATPDPKLTNKCYIVTINNN